MKNVVDVNHWQHANQANISEGQANTMYIQLVNLDWSTKASPEQSSAFAQYPIRYISEDPALGVEAQFLNIDDAQEFTISGTQPFPDDKSIWKFDLTSDQIPAAGNMIINITEGGVVKSFLITQAIKVNLLNAGGC